MPTAGESKRVLTGDAAWSGVSSRVNVIPGVREPTCYVSLRTMQRALRGGTFHRCVSRYKLILLCEYKHIMPCIGLFDQPGQKCLKEQQVAAANPTEDFGRFLFVIH